MITTYIIGGAPRSGKSQVAKYILDNHKIPYITTDLLREGFKHSIPDSGIRSYIGQSDEERSRILWPYFKGIIEARKNYSDRLVIEGTNFLPELLDEVRGIPYIQICFLGYPNISVDDKFKHVREHEASNDNWTDELSDKELINLIEEFIEISKGFKLDCEKYDFKFFDTSENFDYVVKQAASYLLN